MGIIKLNKMLSFSLLSNELPLYNFTSPKDTKQFRLKKATTLILLIALYWIHNLMISIYGIKNPDCIQDLVFDLTAGINSFLAENKLHRDILLIVAGLFMDIMLYTLFCTFIVYHKNWRLAMIFMAFFGLRSGFQQIFVMSFPEGYIWEYPGIMSLTVFYEKTNDFFYSGHIGVCIISIHEFLYIKKHRLAYFSVITLFVEAFAMIATRGHFFFDLVTGAVIAHYICLSSLKIYQKLNEKNL